MAFVLPYAILARTASLFATLFIEFIKIRKSKQLMNYYEERLIVINHLIIYCFCFFEELAHLHTEKPGNLPIYSFFMITVI